MSSFEKFSKNKHFPKFRETFIFFSKADFSLLSAMTNFKLLEKNKIFFPL